MIAEFTAPEATADDAELLISHPFTCSRGTGEARVGLLFSHDDKVVGEALWRRWGGGCVAANCLVSYGNVVG
jgi:hypothetical protein